MAKYGEMHKRIVRLLGVMLVASLLLATLSLFSPARKALAGPSEPEGYCDYFWYCWKRVGCNFQDFCQDPACLEAGYKFLYQRYQRYAGDCAACPAPCCWEDTGTTMSSCNSDEENCPEWCPGSP
jgi:hypothetical protein